MKKILIITLLISFGSLKAQYLKPYFNTLSVENGLPEGYVVSSLQDKLGYMWLGTQNGIIRFDGYELKSYSFPDENGQPLLQVSIRAMLEDKNDKLWALVGNEGLFYLNRQMNKFIRVPLDSADTKIFKNHYFLQIIEEQKYDRHWLLGINVKNYKPSLYAYDVQQNKIEKIKISSNRNQYTPSFNNADILQDAYGKIWVAADSLISFFNPSTNECEPWFVLPDNTKNVMISGLTADPVNDDMIWVSTFIPGTDLEDYPDGMVFYHVNTKTKEYKSFKHIENDPSSIASHGFIIINDSLNRTWFSTRKGISLYNPKDESFINYEIDLPTTRSGNNTYIETISADKEGNLWLGGSFNGLFYLDVKTSKTIFTQHNTEPGSLPDTPRGINKLFYDRSGTFWVSMPWRGIAYLDHQKSMLNPIPIEIPSGEGFEIASQDDFIVNGKYDDNIYFVSNASGLFKWNYKENSFNKIELRNNHPYGQVHTVYTNNDGLIWIGTTSGGLFRYNPLNKSVKNFTHNPNDSASISSNSVTVMIEDKEGNLWVGTSGQGLCRLNKANSTFTRFPFISNNGNMIPDNALDDDRVLSIYLDKEDILWIGTNNGGLNRFDTKTEKFTSYLDEKNGFYCVVNIFEDSQNRMWVGTYLSGLFLFDRETTNKKRYSEEDGLIFNAVMGITEDNSNNIWIASARGLSMLNPESNDIAKFHTPIGDLNSNNVLFRDSNGLIQFSITDGLISFNPEKIAGSNIPPSIVIESVNFTNSSNMDTTIFTKDGEQILLKYNENKLNFHFVALHYANSEQNQYAYKLEGYDKEWIQAGTQQWATYTNLSPGKYIFKAVSANSDDIWNESGPGISIHISPPWWQTTFAYVVYALLFIAAVILVDRIQRKRLREKANQKAREKELAQAKEIEKAYHKLKTTQTQLVQAEKMASLGELTAGIAHEIQNPLNFVNNFSEVNAELIAELTDEISAGHIDEVLSIAKDLKGNEEKIIHHGKRADAIVKNMLQHSRGTGVEKQLTDINALADEYLRLSYHGLRAKDKLFNADFKTDFDKNLPMINLVPQDIGRVLLNLINNAFYAVNQKSKSSSNGYNPIVTISTKLEGSNVVVSVKDNGQGVPEEVKDKIFQPFFTTKPTGEGTGLGLSLSYDIITKGHEGKMKVTSIEGKGSEFIIHLPV